MGYDLRIGGRAEDKAQRLQAFLKGGVILDDAVVREDDLAVPADVRMRVRVGDSPVGRRTGSADREAAMDWLFGDQARELLDAADPLADRDSIVAEHRQPGTVVPAILQAAEPLNEDLTRLPLPPPD